MIEQSVSLASNGVVKVPGYEQLVRFGYTKNQGVYRLRVDATGEWEGLTIRCFWHVPDGKDPASSLVVNGSVDVPASVTAQPGNGCLTFEGSDGTKTVTSADLRYRVSANSGTEDGTEPELGTPAWQQLVDAVHTDATAAEQAKTDAQTAAQQAGASAQKAGQALSDTITAKEDALKAIGDKQTTATQAVDKARDKALKQVDASTKAAQTAASEAATSASNASQSAQEAAGSLQELKAGIASGDFKGEKGDPGPAVALDTTLTHEGEAADAKATGDAISAVKARQNILIGTETGNPIAVDDAFAAPLCGLSVYGRSTQDGTPSPDSPVPIVSAGDGGSVTVKVTGKNLLDIPDGTRTFRGITVTAKNGIVSISGTATESGYALIDIVPVFMSDVVILSSSIATPKVSLVSSTWVPLLFQGVSAKMSDTATRICFTVTQGQTYNLTGVKIQLELGSTATTYSPYREQILTLPTPNGLPGIPVTSGGNYTDPQGQQWVCDEVDLERGVMVQKVYKVDVDGENVKFEQAGGYCNLTQRKLPQALYSKSEMCYGISTIIKRQWYFNKDFRFLYLTAVNLADQLNESCKKQLGKIYYALATPIEKPLTPAELAAYKALTAYGPDTVVQAGDGVGVKLDYQRDVNIAIKKLEDAIASMT